MTDISNSSTTGSSGKGGAGNGDQGASALKSSLVSGAHGVSDGVKHAAEDVLGETRKSAETQVSAGKTRAAEGLKSVASALRKTGEQLRQEDQDAFTQYFDQAAQRVDAVSGYIRKRTLPELVTDMEGFARRDPALFIGGALVLGLLGGRFLKSSRPSASAGAPSGSGRSGQTGQFSQSAQPSHAHRTDGRRSQGMGGGSYGAVADTAASDTSEE